MILSLYLLVHVLRWCTITSSTSLCLAVLFYVNKMEENMNNIVHSYPNGMCLYYLVYTSWHLLCAGVPYQLALVCAWVYDST